MTDGTGTTTRVYDVFNRATSKTVPYIGTSTYVYDQTAGLTTGCTAQTTTDPNGNVTKKVYDRVGRISEVIADSMKTVFHYFDNGSLKISYTAAEPERITPTRPTIC